MRYGGLHLIIFKQGSNLRLYLLRMRPVISIMNGDECSSRFGKASVARGICAFVLGERDDPDTLIVGRKLLGYQRAVICRAIIAH